MSTFVENIRKKLQAMQNNNVFRDVSLLSDSYLPDELKHREKQIDQLLACIAAFLQSRQQTTVLVFGPPGTGKTLTVMKVLQAVDEIRRIYVNCAEVNTKYRILAQIAEQCGEHVPFTGLPTDMIVTRTVDALKGQTTAVVLDEIDYLFKSPQRMHDIRDVIYILTRTQGLELLLIGISNTLGFLSYLDTRTRSSLRHQEIHFPPYRKDELLEILWERVSHAFQKGVLSREVFERCVEETVRTTRDIRQLTSLFRKAGELMMKRGENALTISTFREAMELSMQEETEKLVFGLPLQQLLALATIDSMLTQVEKITTGEAYEEYVRLCKKHKMNPVTMRRFYDYLRELAENSLISIRTISRGRYGKTSEITRGDLPVPHRVLDNILSDNDPKCKEDSDERRVAADISAEEYDMLQMLYAVCTRGESVDDTDLVPPERRLLRKLEEKGLARCIVTVTSGARRALWVVTEKGKKLIESP